ncbi:unnamed protein product [Protopolystoma xenopodis]|uniref:Uncharacterized protein n=1 Tax=Protopolystoma xenopodis TaxID=117903 RepID=A0A3S5B750_9PLAT|nr:unnamed protein product [Protopolystoma xenopodis]
MGGRDLNCSRVSGTQAGVCYQNVQVKRRDEAFRRLAVERERICRPEHMSLRCSCLCCYVLVNVDTCASPQGPESLSSACPSDRLLLLSSSQARSTDFLGR